MYIFSYRSENKSGDRSISNSFRKGVELVLVKVVIERIQRVPVVYLKN